MRICIVTEYLDSTGGTPTILSNLVRYLHEHYSDLSIDVITSNNLYRGEAKLPRYEKWGGIDIYRLRTPKSNRSSTMLRVAAGLVFSTAAFFKLLMRREYDLLFIVTNPPSLPLAAQTIKRLRGTPYVYLVHDLYPDVAVVLGVLSPESSVANVFKHFQRKWLHASDKVIVLGRCMQEHLVQNYAVLKERIEVIPNWCDPNQIVPLPQSRFRTEHNLQGTIVLYAGNFGHYQDFDAILDAAKRLRKTPQDITFVLVGAGAQDEHIAQRIATENIDNVKVFPLVSQKEYPDVLAAADIALVTLARGAEGVGVPSKFYNILASGRPTVAIVAPHSEVALVLQESECGVQVAPGDAEGLAQVVSELAAAPDKMARMGENARKALVEKYTIQQIGEHFYQTLKAVAKDCQGDKRCTT
ncbi:MAG: glycosyltransferase family 4 protein [Armatimonadota bacterium]|nr:glycosyltransferase family 4 protein [Armatimonadota bacterium]